MLAIAGLLIVVVTFLLVFSFNKSYSRKTQNYLRLFGIILLVLTIIFIFYFLNDPLLLIK